MSIKPNSAEIVDSVKLQIMLQNGVFLASTAQRPFTAKHAHCMAQQLNNGKCSRQGTYTYLFV